MHPIIKNILGLGVERKPIEKKYYPPTISDVVKANDNYKRFKASCEILGLEFKEFNKGYQLRCTDKNKKRFDYYPTTGTGNWVGTNKFFDVDSIENFLFINFKN